MKRLGVCLAMAVVLLGNAPAGAMTPAERQQYWEKLNPLLPKVAAFDTWVAESKQLPPDFDALPRINGLPDPFLFLDGKRTVKTAEDWKERRAEIIELFQKYDIGRVPPKPTLDKIEVVDPAVAAAEAAAVAAARGRAGGPGVAGRGGPATGPTTLGRGARGAGGFARGPAGPATGPATAQARGRGPGGRGGGAAPGSITRIVDLKYGPENKITTRVTLTIPPGAGPFPVLMGGDAGITNRGYISCAFNMSVDPPGAPNIGQFYPDYDFGTMGQVAFTARMVVDYLYTLPEVDKRYIAITGYSRAGKMAAVTTMLEERITACIAGSTGVGGVLPWRSAGERGAGEGIESTTRSFPAWFTKSLRFFTGREDRLPIDGNLLAAAIAPRAIISFYGLSDEVGSTYGNEQSYYSAQKVFQLLGVPERNSILQAQGHHGGSMEQANTMHWLDIQFGKSTEKWENKYLFPWDYQKWSTASKESTDLSKYPVRSGEDLLVGAASASDWEKKFADIRKNVQAILGTREGGNPGADPAQRGRDDVVDWAITRGTSFGWLEPQKGKTEYRSITFGSGTRAELYYPKGTAPDAKLPTVIWLHGFSYPMGYMWVYRQNPDVHPILALVEAGYAVVGLDQTGHGSRTDEFATFFDRFPNWSRLGRMVADTSSVIDALQSEGMVDTNRVYLFGYSMGGMVGLHAAALDARIKGVVSICGFTPMRTDTPDRGTGGIARYSIELPLIPQLGKFVGNEAKLPYDYNELIAAIAPRPVLIVQPALDRDANPADVKQAVEQARKVYTLYNAADKLQLDEPWDFNRLPKATQDKVIEWMKRNMK